MSPFPPGWYFDRGTGRVRWWSGRGWTGYYQARPGRRTRPGTWRWVFLCTIGLPILPAYLFARLIYNGGGPRWY